MNRHEYSFGYSRHHSEVWFHHVWHMSTNDTWHDYWWQETLGL